MKAQRMYTVEVFTVVNNIITGEVCSDVNVYAQNPVDAIVITMRKNGYNINRNEVTKKLILIGVEAKVCLLGGTRESVSYYNIVSDKLRGIKYDY